MRPTFLAFGLSCLSLNPLAHADSPIQVGKVESAVEACLQKEAQSMAQRISKGQGISTVDSGSASEDVNVADDKRSVVTYSLDLFSDFGGACSEGEYATVTVSSSGAVEFLSNTYCSVNNPDFQEIHLKSADGSIPLVGYLTADRVLHYDAVQNNVPTLDTLAKLELDFANAPAKALLSNENTQRVTQLYFDVGAYRSCLKSRLKL